MNKDKIKKLLKKKEELEERHSELEEKWDEVSGELRITDRTLHLIKEDLRSAYENDFEEAFQDWCNNLNDADEYRIPNDLNQFLFLSDSQALKAQFIIETESTMNSVVGGQFTFKFTPTSLGTYVEMHNTATGKKYDLTEDFE